VLPGTKQPKEYPKSYSFYGEAETEYGTKYVTIDVLQAVKVVGSIYPKKFGLPIRLSVPRDVTNSQIHDMVIIIL
jgi:hypothetical protein